MGCSISIDYTVGSGFSGFNPLHTAIYLASTDKILGSSQNFIIEHNAATGAPERAVKFKTPTYGNMHLGFIDGDPYCALNSDPSIGSSFVLDSVLKDIFPVDPVTLLAGAALGLVGIVDGPGTSWFRGPLQFLSVGTKTYALWASEGFVKLVYFDSTNVAGTIDEASASGSYWSEQHTTNGSFVWTADPYYQAINQWNVITNANADFDVSPYYPVGCEHAANVNKIYAVCGDTNLLKLDTGTTNVDQFNLGTIQAGVRPLRLRYCSVVGNPFEGKILIPCSLQDVVIVWDPSTDTGELGTGSFASPIDIVYTPTKAFAVQSSDTGLVEVT